MFTYDAIAKQHVKCVEGSNYPLATFEVILCSFTEVKLLSFKIVKESTENCFLLLLRLLFGKLYIKRLHLYHWRDSRRVCIYMLCELQSQMGFFKLLP